MPTVEECLREQGVRPPGPDDLDLSNNRLSGPIPAELGRLVNLQHLDLYYNQLSGPIPAELGRLVNLQRLNLSSNELSGPIPAELGRLVNLHFLDLDNNQLSGPIPAELGQLVNLWELALNNNQLSGPIPAELGRLVNLHFLGLQNNQLSGEIDPTLALPAHDVNISNNYLTHTPSIPTHWKQENAFQQPSQEMIRQVQENGEKMKNKKKKHDQTNLLPSNLIAHLQLEGIHEEHTLSLSQLMRSQQVPSSLDEWAALGLDIGFPDNGVWSCVAHALASMPNKVDEAAERHASTRQRISELKSELSQLEAQQAQWAEWEEPIQHLQSCAGDMVEMAQRLSEVEHKLSVQAMQQFAAHALPSSDCEDEAEQIPAVDNVSASAWQVILRSAGLCAESAEQLKDKMDDILFLTDGINLTSLSQTERWDIRYLSQMVEWKSVPFVHPFGERYDLNRQHEEEDATPGAYESQHSCVVCECTTPQKLINLVKEMKSPLAKVDWAAHSINGPRMIMMSSQEMQELFQVDKKSATALMKAQRSLKNKHRVSAGQE